MVALSFVSPCGGRAETPTADEWIVQVSAGRPTGYGVRLSNYTVVEAAAVGSVEFTGRVESLGPETRTAVVVIVAKSQDARSSAWPRRMCVSRRRHRLTPIADRETARGAMRLSYPGA